MKDKRKVECRRVLKFYFAVDKLNGVIDNLIYKNAMDSIDGGRDCDYYAERMIELIDVKRRLSLLWAKLDEVLTKWNEDDLALLEKYAFMRCCCFDEELKKGLHKVVSKFCRQAGEMILRHGDVVKIIGEFWFAM